MANYVNEEKFIEWYNSVSKEELRNKSELLTETVSIYSNTGKALYTLPAGKTKSGKEESYEYKVENLGCCGASTIMVTF